MKKQKFMEELIELLFKYDLSVDKFLDLINDEQTWMQKLTKKQFQKIKKEGIEV